MDSKLLKLAAKQIAPSLSYLFNLSLSKGMILEDFKLARVTPIFNGKGDSTIIPFSPSVLYKGHQLYCYLYIQRDIIFKIILCDIIIIN